MGFIDQSKIAGYQMRQNMTGGKPVFPNDHHNYKKVLSRELNEQADKDMKKAERMRAVGNASQAVRGFVPRKLRKAKKLLAKIQGLTILDVLDGMKRDDAFIKEIMRYENAPQLEGEGDVSEVEIVDNNL